MHKPPIGWREYSPTDRRRWPPPRRQILAAVAAVIAMVSLSLIGYSFGWWSTAGQYPWAIGLAVAFFIAVIALISIGYRKKWTGFGDKSLWNWLQLLIIPIVLAVGGLLFTMAQDERQQAAEERRAQAQRDAEEQRAQDQALQAYFEEMGNLLLDEDLRTSQEDADASNDEASTIARARTLTILGRVDPERKKSVVQFLYESNLIQKDQPIVSLAGADLRYVDLRYARLTDADLSYADLTDAILTRADLTRADLSAADLSDAVLSNAHLSDAVLTRAVLRGADLTRAGLRYADLSYAVLTDAILTDADLRYADLRYAILTDADLTDADLRDAVLTRAVLRGAPGISNEKLEEQAESLEGATMPDGLVHE